MNILLKYIEICIKYWQFYIKYNINFNINFNSNFNILDRLWSRVFFGGERPGSNVKIDDLFTGKQRYFCTDYTCIIHYAGNSWDNLKCCFSFWHCNSKKKKKHLTNCVLVIQSCHYFYHEYDFLKFLSQDR